MVRWLVMVAMTLVMMGGALAQQAAGPEDRVKPIAPFVNLQTVYVGCVDVAKVDVDALEAWTVEASKLWVEPEEQAEAQGQIKAGMGVVRQLKAALLEAKAERVYWVGDTDMIEHGPGFAAIPAGENADALSTKLQGLLGNGVVVRVEKDTVLVAGERDAAELADYGAADRPELVKAMQGSDAPVMIALLLPNEVRRDITTKVPTLPPQLGGHATAPLVEGYRWGVLELRLPPTVSLRALVTMKDQAGAAAMETVVNGWLEMMGRMGVQMGMDWAGLRKALTPKVEGEHLAIELGSEQVRTLVEVMGPGLRQARAQAKRVASMSNMRQILIGMMMYRNENKGRFPEKLDDLAKYLQGAEGLARLMVNPVRPGQTPGYVYCRPADRNGPGSPMVMVLYEAFEKWPGAVAGGFADGHVEQIRDEARFKTLLERSPGD